MEEPSTEVNILILGDGNFSFSFAYCQQILDKLSLRKKVHIYCTSFDSEEEILKKYPESNHYLRYLRKESHSITVLHNIDATNLQSTLLPSLPPPSQSSSSSSTSSSSSSSSSSSGFRFHEVIFNFPHLGYEDLIIHQSFLAHLFHAVRPFLSSFGCLIISLAQSQQLGWKLDESAARLGYQLEERIAVEVACWPGYELKRHHTGKSFKNRVQDCYHYVYRLNDCNETQRMKSFFQLNYENYRDGLKHDQIAVEASESKDEGPRRPKKKRKVHQLVEGHYEVVTANDSSQKAFQCKFCEKVFPTDQGIRTHVYTVHLLPSFDQKEIISTTPGEEKAYNIKLTTFPCLFCERLFPNEDACYQHQRSRHSGLHEVSSGRRTASELEFAITMKPKTGNEHNCLQCLICLLRFSTEDELSSHLQHAFEPRSAEYNYCCEYCQKSFTNDRAWRQHVNFCSIKKSAETVTIEEDK